MTGRRFALTLLVGAVMLDTAAAPPLAGVGAPDRRVLIIAARSASDARLAAQRREIAHWGPAAHDRDLVTVEVAGTRVLGADEPAAALRRRYDLRPDAFTIVLIGKDGHVAYRADRPLTAAAMVAIIDAMPMRRAGLR